MSIIFSSSVWVKLVTLTLTSSLANLFVTTVVWGQSSASSNVHKPISQFSQQIQRDSVRQSHQLEKYSTSAADLLLTCDNDLSKISHLSFKSYCQSQAEQLAQTDSKPEGEEEESQILEPTNVSFCFTKGSRKQQWRFRH